MVHILQVYFDSKQTNKGDGNFGLCYYFGIFFEHRIIQCNRS